MLFIRYCEIYKYLAEEFEFKCENANTKEQLVARNEYYGKPVGWEKDAHYVEILRHPLGAEAKMQDWLRERAYFEKYGDERQVISTGLGWPMLTIG